VRKAASTTPQRKRKPRTDAAAGVQSVAIAARVLKALAAGGGALALKDLAAATQMPRAKVHRYLAGLRGAELVDQDLDSGHYRIGSAAVTIGLVGLGRLSPVRQLHEALPHLRDQVNETITAAIWGEHGPTIVAIEESDHLVTMNVRIGTVLPLTTTAIGRLFLAYLPASATRRMAAVERRRDGDAAPPEGELADLLAGIRARRLSAAASALIPGVDAIAAPVFDSRGKLAAVICAVGRAGGMSTRWDGSVSQAVAATAARLSLQLGYVEATQPAVLAGATRPDEQPRAQPASRRTTRQR
jgi:DNA-binding IclR family transcriptional regulator